MLPRLLEAFVADLETFDGLSEKTTKNYVQCLKRIERATGRPISSNPAYALEGADIRATFQADSLAPATRYLVLMAAKRFERWREDNGYASTGAMQLLSLARPPANPPRPLSRREIQALKEACVKERHMRLVWLGLYAGTRIAESAAMTAVHWRSDRLRFSGKGNKTREVPIHPELAGWRDIILRQGPTTDARLHHDVAWLRGRVGFHWTAHNLRDSFAQSLIDAEVPLEIVEALLGHASESMTLRHYATIPWARKSEAVARLPY